MSTLLTERHHQTVAGTSTGSSVRTQATYRRPLIMRVLPSFPETTNTEQISTWKWSIAWGQTTSGIALSSQATVSTEATRTALNELRKLSGLTWEQLARLFNVSRRSLHFWASGQPLSSFNEENLNRMLGTIRYINRGSASVNRSLLLSPNGNGRILLDLLVAGQHEEVKRLLGPGNTPQKSLLKPLSPDAVASRTPSKPEDLVDALHDPIHHEVGRSRAVRAVRSRKRDRKQ